MLHQLRRWICWEIIKKALVQIWRQLLWPPFKWMLLSKKVSVSSKRNAAIWEKSVSSYAVKENLFADLLALLLEMIYTPNLWGENHENTRCCKVLSSANPSSRWLMHQNTLMVSAKQDSLGMWRFDWILSPERKSCCTPCPDCEAPCDGRENKRINNRLMIPPHPECRTAGCEYIWNFPHLSPALSH